MSSVLDWLQSLGEVRADPARLRALAAEQEAAGHFHRAAAACDAAYTLEPTDAASAQRRSLLDRLSLAEHGLTFRYIPAGRFLMGSARGDPDERPVHAVELDYFWLTETPVSWTDYCRLLGWSAPPEGMPPELPPPPEKFPDARFYVRLGNQIRLQYCETETTRARDWHAHDPNSRWRSAGAVKTAQELFGWPARRDPEAPWSWDRKPMVAVSWGDVEDLAQALTGAGAEYGLPTEAEWERAARGGLAGCRYAWGDAPPNPELCDCARLDELSIRLPRELPPNGYGLYGMCGGVWEWTADWYDAEYYRQSPERNPTGPARGEERVLRGGSWTDCPDAVTVSFRMSREPDAWRDGAPRVGRTPNIGFRLARRETP